MPRQFATLNVIHDEINAVCFLKDIIHPNDERMVDLIKNYLLTLNVINSIVFDHHIFPYALHCVVLLCLFAIDEVDFPEGSSPNYIYHFEVVKGSIVYCSTSIQQRRGLILGSILLLDVENTVKRLRVKFFAYFMSLVCKHLLRVVQCISLSDASILDAIVQGLHEYFWLCKIFHIQRLLNLRNLIVFIIDSR